MSKYMKKNEKQNKKKAKQNAKKKSLNKNNEIYLNNVIGSRKIIKETDEFIKELYMRSDMYRRIAKTSTTETDYEVNRALSMFAKDIADLLDARFDKYKIM